MTRSVRLSEGARVGPYRIVTPLGAGAMGEVYHGVDTRLGRDVALKVLPASLSGEGRRRARFEREARAASGLNHPNIVTIYECGESDGTFYIAMELVGGSTLRQIMDSGPLPTRKLLQVAIQVADGLAKAHAAGIVHRDLKPENVMLTKDGVAKILDFGLSKLVAPLSGPEGELDTVGLGFDEDGTQPGLVLGTVGYMSPEQAEGRPADHRADQFAVGVLLYEMASRKRAFQRATAVETLTAILRDEPEPLTVAAPTLAPPLRWIIERCLAKDPEDRYASTRDLARDLQIVRDRLSEAGSMEAALLPAPRPPARRARAGLALASAVLVFAAGSLIARWLARPGASEVPRVQYLTYSGHDFSPAASPDGRTVAFTSDRDGVPRVWLKDLRGGGEVAFTSGPDDFPRFSDDGSSLLFSRTEGGRTALYRQALVGGEARRLVADVSGGDWSPDGRMAFVRVATEGGVVTSMVRLVSADGGEEREVARLQNRRLLHPRWSPDGGTIAAVEIPTQAGSPSSIVLVDAVRGGFRSLRPASAVGILSSAAWCCDGRALVYSHTESVLGLTTGGSARVIRQDARTGDVRTLLWVPHSSVIVDVLGPGRLVLDTRSSRQNLREVALAPGAQASASRWITRGNSSDRQPAYSPDGEWIVFSSNRSGNLDLWIVSTRTGAVRRLTDDKAEDWDPAFTPDGKSILWSSNRGGHFEIWVAAADGSGSRQVTKDGVDAENPTATPEGWIVYNSANPAHPGVFKIRPDGSADTLLVAGTVILPEVSPDGKYATFLADWASERVAIRVARVGDGAAAPFETRVVNPRRSFLGSVGRSRWMPGGRAIAFTGRDEKGVDGVFVQDFVPGRDTLATRRPLGGFDSEATTESFGISPDGSRMTVAGWEQLYSLMTAEGVADVTPARRQR